MKAKYKITGFARLVLFLLAISPICYIGARYIQENPDWNEIKNELVEKASEKISKTISSSDENIQMENMEAKIQNLEFKVEELKEKLEEKDDIIKELIALKTEEV